MYRNRPAIKQLWRDGRAAALLTIASGVAVAEAVRTATGLPAEIKWPNDVLVGRRKLAGILTEAAAQGGELQFVVAGPGHQPARSGVSRRTRLAGHLD
jgi:biotin-(acetyl-CoA carboxylase) ligase